MRESGPEPIEDGLDAAGAPRTSGQPGLPAAPADPAVAAALAEAQAWIGDRVWAVGLGADEAGRPAVVVLAAPDADVPAEVGGMPVVRTDSGPIQAETRTDPEGVSDAD